MSAFSSSIADSGEFAVKPNSACARTNCALGFGLHSFASSRQCTPLKRASNRLQRGTQWMSLVTSVAGSDFSVVVERQLCVDLAPHAQRPRLDVDLGNFARVQHRPL